MKISILDLCLCGSGIQVINCCFKKVSTTPIGSKTNYSHPKCYARALCDCSRGISKEHFLSKSVLDLFGDTAKVNAPFIEKEGKILKLKSLSANILCERHNNALSPLDNVAKKYFEFVLGKTSSSYLIILGSDLERWMLKLMCGVIATGHGQTPRGMLITGLEPPLAALETLFNSLELPKNWGLAIPYKSGVDLNCKLHFCILADQNHARGMALTFSYIQLFYFLQPIPTLHDQKITLYHRPSSIGYMIDNVYREVHLGWPNGKHLNLSFTSKEI